MKITKKTLLILFLIFFWNPLFSKPLIYLKTTTSQLSEFDGEEDFFLDFSESMFLGLLQLPIPINDNQEITILKNEGRIIALLDCLMDVYQWNGTSWDNIYKYENSGYNCDAYPYFQNQILYSLGGYGFWNNHSDLISFHEESGSWEFEKTANQPSDYRSFAVGIGEKSAFILLGRFRNPRADLKKEFENDGYILNLADRQWSNLSFDGIISTPANPSGFILEKILGVDTENFMVFEAHRSDGEKKGFLLFNKNNLNIRFLNYPVSQTELISAKWKFISGDKLSFLPAEGTIKQYDIAQFFSKSEFVGVAQVIPISKRLNFLENTLFIPIVLVFGIFCGVLFSFLSFRKSKKKMINDLSDAIALMEQSSNIKEDNIQEIYEKFQSFHGVSLSTEQLDQELGIDKLINFESKRSKRSLLIKELNQKSMLYSGKSLISRKRNDEDRRYLIYQINFSGSK